MSVKIMLPPLTCDHISECRTGAFIGNVNEVDAGHHLQHLARQMARTADPGRRQSQSICSAFCQLNDVGQRMAGTLGWVTSR